MKTAARVSHTCKSLMSVRERCNFITIKVLESGRLIRDI